MSLLQAEKGNVKFSYQLPLRFDEQLGVISKLQSCVNMDTMGFDNAKIWALIKDKVTIEVDGEIVWAKGKENEEASKGKMLGYSFKVSKMFADEFMVFIVNLGVEI